MPLRKKHKKDFVPKLKDEIGDKIYHPKPVSNKVKYKHKNYWLEEYDDDFELPKYKDEEE